MPKRQLFVIFAIVLIFLGVVWLFSPLRSTLFHPTTHLPDKIFSSAQDITVALKGVSVKKAEATLKRFDGKLEGANITTLQKDDTAVYTIKKPVSFRPGKYTLTVVTDDKRTYIQDFSWGVLAINTDKSIYLPHQTAHLSLAVLNEKGEMVCDSKLRLEVKSPKSEVESLSTENGSIKVNPECKVKNYTEKPDYEAEYTVGDTGTYDMTLTATTGNGTYTIHDTFEVRNSVPFDVTRTSATRIYPIKIYPVTLTIIANQDFTGEVIEKVPDAFITKSSSKSAVPITQERINHNPAQAYWTRELVWDVNLKKGETTTLVYTYDAPDESPYFFLLGPLRFVASDKTVFQESKNWQIAVDAVPTAMEQQTNIMDQVLTTTSATNTPSDNSLGLINYTGANYSNASTYFETVMKKVNGDKLNITFGYDGTYSKYSSIYCVSSTDCKIAYVDQTNNALRFRDCDDTKCSSGTNTVVDGHGCVVTGCLTTRDIVGTGPSSVVAISCPATNDCKVLYTTWTGFDLYFLDCDNATCTSGTTQMIDGGAGCTLTNCNTDTIDTNIALDCSTGATDCKIVFSNTSKTAVDFIDCDNATCTAGTIQVVDGDTGCLTSCTSGDSAGTRGVAIDCTSGTSDCKVGYYEGTKSAIFFADCADAQCDTGTVHVVDGDTGCLTGCNSGDSIPSLYGFSMDCPSAIDCKFAYHNGTKNALYFADCDDATCSTGNVTLVDGDTGCSLTGCTTNNYKQVPSIDCTGGSTDCKLFYYDLNGDDLFFGDCDNSACTSGVRKTIDGGASCTLTGCSTSNSMQVNTSMFCVSSTDCKVVYVNASATDLYFGDCDDGTCGTGFTTYIDGAGAGHGDSGKFSDIYCVSSDDCKAIWYEANDSALHFRDCDNESCSSGTNVFLDGISGCMASGCITGDDTGQSGSIFCLSSTDCKIAYTNVSKTALYFIDCDSATCDKSTTTIIDGTSPCTLTNCSTGGSVGINGNAGRLTSLFCSATDDCKIVYIRGSDLYFADCSTATCSGGTISALDGTSPCALTGCNTGDSIASVWGEVSMQCPATDDCKIAYYNFSKSALYFGDCATATCSSGTTTILDGTVGCVFVGTCSSGDDTGQSLDLDCTAGATDCKIVYWDTTTSNDGFNFIDCDSADCTTGTLQNIFGKVACPLTNCITTTTNSPNYGAQIDCLGNTNDCKIGFYVTDQSGMYFADCDSSTCNSGNVQVLDGVAACVLSGCITADSMGNNSQAGMDCVSTTDCKLVYYDFTANNAIFADCSTVNCSNGTSLTIEDKDDEYAWAQLYTSAGAIVADAISMLKTNAIYTRVRATNALTLSDGGYTVRAFSSDDSDVTSEVQSARLVMDQASGGGITATESQVELGNNETTTSSSYGTLSSPKIYLFDSTKYDGTITVNFEATMKGSAGGVTASAVLSSDPTCTSNVAGSDVTVTGTTWTRSRTASPITLSDNTEYFVCFKTSSGTGSISNAKLIVTQQAATGIQYTEYVHQYLNTAQTDTDSTYTSQNYLNQLLKSVNIGDSVKYFFETTMKTSGGTGYAQLYNITDSTNVTGGELTTTGSSFSRSRSTDLATNVASGKDYDVQLKNSATNTTTVSNAWMVIDIATSLAQPRMKGPMRIKGGVRFR